MKQKTHHDGTNSRIQAMANNCSDEMFIMGKCIAVAYVAINKSSILKQREELFPERINSFHRLC